MLSFRPIKQWPEGWPRTAPQWSPFRATYSDTLVVLQRELDMLEAKSASLALDVRDRDVRVDGQLRSDVRVNNQGVILTVETPMHGTLVYACDEFEEPGHRRSPDWHANLRAIALGLEALRKVERYGIANRGQQYAGYRELGAGIPMAAPLSADQAAAFIAEQSVESPLSGRAAFTADEVLNDASKRAAAYRIAAKRLHPDKGGDADLFKRLTEARDVLAAAES